MAVFKDAYTGRQQGTYKMQCDRTGFVGMSNDMRRTWDGKWVLKEYWYPRNPQEFITTPNVKLSVPVARPIKTKLRGDDDGIF